MAVTSSSLNQCLDFTRALLENNRRFSVTVQTSDGFTFTFNNIGNGTPSTNERKKSSSQLRRDQLRMGKFNQKKKEIQKPGNPEVVENLVGDENPEESVDKLELQYVTGEWYKAPNDSGNFGNLFKPTFKGVDKIMN